MKNILTLFLFLAALLVIPAMARAQVPEIGEASSPPIAEMKKLF